MERLRDWRIGLLALLDGAGVAAAGLVNPVYIAAGLAALAALSSVLGPAIGLHWLVLALPFQDLAVDLGVSMFSPVDGVVYLVLLGMIWGVMIRGGQLRLRWGTLGVLALSGIFFLPSLFTAPDFAKGLKDLVRFAVAVITALIAREAVVRSSDPPKLARRILSLFVLTGLFLAVVLFRQVVSGGGNLVERLMMNRGRSLFLDPNYFATYMVMTLTAAVGLFLQARTWPRRTLWGGACLLLLTAVGLSLSRAGYLAAFALAGLGLVYVWRDRAHIARLGGLIAVALLLMVGSGIFFWKTLSETIDPEIAGRRLELLFSGRDYSVMKRVLILKGAARMIERHPLTGVGLGQFETVYDSYKLPSPFASHQAACHNTPLRLLAETGVVGFVPFAVAFAAVLSTILRGFRPLRRFGLSPLYFGITGAIAVFGLMALTLDQMFRFHLWMMIGLALGLAAWARDEERRG